jgi:hypothetical protein
MFRFAVCLTTFFSIADYIAGVEGAVRDLKSIHLADRCILTKLE